MSAPTIVICPRECPSPKTDHCLGELIDGRARCFRCGRWMPMDEAIEAEWDEAPETCHTDASD